MIPSATGSEGDVKRLELLREAIPGARRPGYLGMSYERARAVELMASAAARLGIELAMHWVDGPAEYASAFAAMRNEGAAGAVRMGIEHGLYCLGCCWVPMALLFAVGVMNLLWMAVLTAFVLIEKLVPAGQWIPRVSGLLLLGFGVFLLTA